MHRRVGRRAEGKAHDGDVVHEGDQAGVAEETAVRAASIAEHALAAASLRRGDQGGARGEAKAGMHRREREVGATTGELEPFHRRGERGDGVGGGGADAVACSGAT